MSLLIRTTELVKEKEQNVNTDIFNYRSKELFINLDKKDIPPVDSVEREDFILWEEQKCKVGVTVNGIFIPPTLYWDFNHFAIEIDTLDRNGDQVFLYRRPDLRDNDWIIHNALWECETDPTGKKNLVLGTARQISKSKNIGSVFTRDLLLYDLRRNLLMAGSEIDLDPIIKYITVGSEHCSEFFRVPMLTQNKKADKIEFGIRTSEGSETIVKSTLYVRNASMGKNTQVAAGVTIHRAAVDEVGKFLFKKSYNAIEPALKGKYGIRSSSIIAFTGGSVEQSKDAESLFMNPAGSNFKEFENEGKKTGLFLGGIYRQDLKEDVKLGEYLGLKEEDSELYNLTIRVANVEKANRILDAEEELKRKSSNPVDLIDQKMQNPRKIADMFLTPNVNPFVHLFEGMEEHKQKLILDRIGTPVELYKAPDGKIQYNFSKKTTISTYPTPSHESLDTPIMVYDFPKYEDFGFGLHTMSVDPINDEDATDTSSLAAIYVYRRKHSDLSDGFQEAMVASWVGRTKDWLKTAELLQEFYNAEVLYENSGNSFKQYFERNKKFHVLLNTYDLQRTIFPQTNIKATTGIKATPKNISYGLNSMKMYLEEELPNGLPGYTRILDPVLIDEIKAFDGTGPGSRNVDRFMSFMWGTVHLQMYSKYNPIVIKKQVREEKPSPPRYAFGNMGKGRSLKMRRSIFG